jgi:hypothetical protein
VAPAAAYCGTILVKTVHKRSRLGPDTCVAPGEWEQSGTDPALVFRLLPRSKPNVQETTVLGRKAPMDSRSERDDSDDGVTFGNS